MELLKKIEEAGVVGAGGAGFPTHVKLNSKVDTFIINAAECEPLLETDKYLMRHMGRDLVEAVEIVGTHLGATRKIIGLKEKYKKEIEALNKVISDKGYDIEIYKSRNFYPAGDEQILVREIMGKSIPQGGIPLDVGAVVSNVATLIDVNRALSGEAVTKRIITITGEVNNPTLIEAPIGLSVAKCIELAGGSSIKDFSVILGGPMMGSVCKQDELATTYVTKTLGGIIVLPTDQLIFQRKKLQMSTIISRATSTCIQCRMCTDLCPRYLIGHEINPHKVMRAIGHGEKSLGVYKEALSCCECGVCEMFACPMGLSPKTVNQYVKKMLMENGVRVAKDVNKEFEANDMREYRKVQTDRLIARIDLSKYKKIHLDDLIKYEVSKNEIFVINLKQHIGAKSEPQVKVGQMVSTGECIARIPEKALGANIHSSVSGEVIEIGENIKIRTKINMGW